MFLHAMRRRKEREWMEEGLEEDGAGVKATYRSHMVESWILSNILIHWDGISGRETYRKTSINHRNSKASARACTQTHASYTLLYFEHCVNPYHKTQLISHNNNRDTKCYLGSVCQHSFSYC